VTNPLFQVRLRIGDTNEDDPLLQDEEILFFLEQMGGNVLDASIRACFTIIAFLAGQVDFRVGPYSESNGNRLKWYQALLDQLSALQPGMSILMKPPTTPPIFKYEMFGMESLIDPVSDLETSV
jgi:hypothetical protein